MRSRSSGADVDASVGGAGDDVDDPAERADPATTPAESDGDAAEIDVGQVDVDPAAIQNGDQAAVTTAPSNRLLDFVVGVHPALWLTILGALVFTIVFGSLGVQHHRNFGTWAFDMGIYDQSFWLVSQGKSWVTVRGLDFWGHHINLIAIAFAPAYWLGAGPSFLYVVQAGALGAGAIPTYLLARDRMRNPWVGLVFAFVFLM